MENTELYNKYPNIPLLSFIDRGELESFSVLEIGCYRGTNLIYVKEKYPNCICCGVDIDKEAISIAEKGIDCAIVADIEKQSLHFDEKSFDYIIFGDVLEHLKDPLSCLIYCERFLKDSGKILISIPNIQHVSILRELVHGRFIYEDTGLLDKTHLKFFTYYDFLLLLKNAHLSPKQIIHRIVPIDEECTKLIDYLLSFNSSDVKKFMYEAYQYMVVAQKEE